MRNDRLKTNNKRESRTDDRMLDDEVMLMLERRRGSWPSIAKGSGVSYSWICHFAAGAYVNPGYRTLRRLYLYLRQATAPAPAPLPPVPPPISARPVAARTRAVRPVAARRG